MRRRQVRSRRPHRAQWLGAHRSLARPNLSHDGLQYPRARTPERPQALTLASALPATRCRRRSRWRFSSLTCSHWRFPLDTRPLLTAPQDGGPAAARHGAAGGGCAEPAAAAGRAAGPAAGAWPGRDAGLLARRERHGGGGGQRRVAGHRRAPARGLAGRFWSRGRGTRVAQLAFLRDVARCTAMRRDAARCGEQRSGGRGLATARRCVARFIPACGLRSVPATARNKGARSHAPRIRASACGRPACPSLLVLPPAHSSRLCGASAPKARRAVRPE